LERTLFLVGPTATANSSHARRTRRAQTHGCSALYGRDRRGGSNGVVAARTRSRLATTFESSAREKSRLTIGCGAGPSPIRSAVRRALCRMRWQARGRVLRARLRCGRNRVGTGSVPAEHASTHSGCRTCPAGRRRTWQGRGIGRRTILRRRAPVARAADEIGIRGIMVHAISEEARNFYLRLGFEPSPSERMTLLVTLADLARRSVVVAVMPV